MTTTNLRIKSLLKRLQTIGPNINIEVSKIDYSAVSLKNIYVLNTTLRELNALQINNDLINNILAETDRVDEGGITSDEIGYEIQRLVKQLSNYIDSLITTLQNILPKEEINSINIKLPPTQNLIDLAKHSRELHLAISQLIINDDINGEEKIESVDNGSIWINLFVGTPLAVSLIAGVFWAAAVIRKKWSEGDFAVEQIKGMKIKNEILENIKEAHNSSIKNLIEAEAKLLQSQHFKDDDPENVQRIQNSIKIFAELIYQGVEIQPALSAPENISNLFPKSLDLIESKIPKIGNS